LLVTALVVAVKVAVVALPATFTLTGTVAPVVACRLTVRPVDGAGPVSVTVPVEELPPITDVGFMLTEASAGGLTVSPACALLLPNVAVIVATVEVLTATVVIGKVAVLAFAATVTLAPTLALLLLLPRETEVVVGAGPDKVTVPVDPFGPTTVDGFTLTEATVRGLMARVACALLVPYVAVMMDEVELLTAVVVAVNVALLALAAMFTLAGTVAPAVLPSETEIALGVGPDKVTVPVDELPPITVLGFMLTELMVSGLMVSVAAVGVTLL